jgi:hypothetical protein
MHIPDGFIDLPTAADIAGVSPPFGLDGLSFLPALLGHEQKPHEFFCWKRPFDQERTVALPALLLTLMRLLTRARLVMKL